MSTPSSIKLRSSSKRQKTVSMTPPSPAVGDDAGEQTPVSVTGGEHRAARVQKVFTEEDKIQLLNSVCEISKSCSSPVLKIDTPIFNRIPKSLGDKFTRAQLNEKLRRLRLKYHKLAKTKSGIKTPLDRQVYEIGRMLWGKNRNASNLSSREVPAAEENGDEGAEEMEEERVGVDLTKYPVLVEEFERLEGNGMWKEHVMGLEESTVRELNDKLVMLKYEEATIIAEKAKLLQELTMTILGSIRSSSGTA